MRSRPSKPWRLALWAMLGGAVIAVACSSYEESTPAADGGADGASDSGGPNGDGGGGGDGSSNVDAATCDLTKPFGTPELIAELSSDNQDYTLAFTSDELTVVVSSFRPNNGGEQLLVASRAKIGDPFPTPTALEIGTDGAVASPSLTADADILFVGRQTAEAGYDLYTAQRLATPGFAFGTPVPMVVVNSSLDDLTPSISADGDEIFFMSNRSGTQAIYRSTRTTSGLFREPTFVTEVFIDGGRQIAPVLSPDGLTLYFAADTPSGLGALDVWMATRPSRAEAFGSPKPLAEVSSPASEQPTWASPDGCRLYLASGRRGLATKFDFFVATKPK